MGILPPHHTCVRCSAHRVDLDSTERWHTLANPRDEKLWKMLIRWVCLLCEEHDGWKNHIRSQITATMWIKTRGIVLINCAVCGSGRGNLEPCNPPAHYRERNLTLLLTLTATHRLSFFSFVIYTDCSCKTNRRLALSYLPNGKQTQRLGSCKRSVSNERPERKLWLYALSVL